jgi:hypothetical protein
MTLALLVTDLRSSSEVLWLSVVCRQRPARSEYVELASFLQLLLLCAADCAEPLVKSDLFSEPLVKR